MPKHREGHAHVTLHNLGERTGGTHADDVQRDVAVRRGFGLYLLALVIGIGMAAALLVMLQNDASEGGRSDQPEVGVLASQALKDGDEEQLLADCAEAWSAVQHVLTRMKPTMEQWEIHIDAMNRLVAGEITLSQAAAFWAQTRLAAARRYEAFADADERLQSAAPTCRAGEDATVTTCARAIDAAHQTLDSARTTLATWHHHILDMNRLRAGTLSPTAAQRMWLATWEDGKADLRSYHRMEQRSDRLTCPA